MKPIRWLNNRLQTLTTRWQRREAIDPGEWMRICAPLPILHGLSREELERLRDLAERFLAIKTLEPVDEHIVIPPDTRLRLSAQACLPILNLDLSWYDGFVSIVIYPAEFFPTHEYVDEAGVVHVVREELAGEAWMRGPVVLSLADLEAADADDGFNLIVHELAHKLDMQNGTANGMPPLHRGMNRHAWTEAFSAAFESLQDQIDAGIIPNMDPYAATDPAEFFAVASEYFFEWPQTLQALYPRVYTLMGEFYRQDPALRQGGNRWESSFGRNGRQCG